MANGSRHVTQEREQLHQIAMQYGLDIGDVGMIPTQTVREALRRFQLGLLPSKLSMSQVGQ